MIGLIKVGATVVVTALLITLAIKKRDKAKEAESEATRMLDERTGSQGGSALPAGLALSPAAGPVPGHRLRAAPVVGSRADLLRTDLGQAQRQWSRRRRARHS